jgi:hypothetical protein
MLQEANHRARNPCMNETEKNTPQTREVLRIKVLI